MGCRRGLQQQDGRRQLGSTQDAAHEALSHGPWPRQAVSAGDRATTVSHREQLSRGGPTHTHQQRQSTHLDSTHRQGFRPLPAHRRGADWSDCLLHVCACARFMQQESVKVLVTSCIPSGPVPRPPTHKQKLMWWGLGRRRSAGPSALLTGCLRDARDGSMLCMRVCVTLLASPFRPLCRCERAEIAALNYL